MLPISPSPPEPNTGWLPSRSQIGHPAAQGGERIDGYDVQLRVEPSGQLVVTETIGYDFGTAQDKHGIERIIPVWRRYDDTRDRIYPIEVVAVSATPATPARYETEEQGSDLVVRIGDPDRAIIGRHGYTITYRVQGRWAGTPTMTSCTGTRSAANGRCRSTARRCGWSPGDDRFGGLLPRCPRVGATLCRA